MEPQEFEQAPPTIEVLGPDGYERRPVAYYDTELDGPFRGVPMTNVGERAVRTLTGWVIAEVQR